MHCGEPQRIVLMLIDFVGPRNSRSRLRTPKTRTTKNPRLGRCLHLTRIMRARPRSKAYIHPDHFDQSPETEIHFQRSFPRYLSFDQTEQTSEGYPRFDEIEQ